MARLPDVTALGSRPVPVNRQGIATQDTSSAGRGMAQFGAVISQVAEDISKKNDEQAVFEARRKLDEWERSTLYDPENGVVAKRGADALDLPKRIPEEYDKFAGEIGKGLTTNRQRQVFQEMAQSRRNQVADFTIRHATTQKEVYEKGQITADIDSSSDRAVMLASNGDTAGARAEIDTASLRLTSFMKQRGASGEEIANALKTNGSKTHAAVVASLVNKGDPLGAQAYLDANKGGMMQDDMTRASGALKEGVLRQKSQSFGDEVTSSGMTLPAALAKARERFTGDEEVAAIHEVKTRFAEAEAVRAQAAKQVTTEAWSMLMEKGSLSAIPATVMTRLRADAPEEERQMRDWLEAKWRRNKADAESKKTEDWGTFMFLQDLANNEPEKFMDPATLLKAEPHLSKSQMAHLVSKRDGISKQDVKESSVQRMVKSTIGMLKGDIAAAGIDLTPDPKNKKAAEESARFMGVLTMTLEQQAAGGKMDEKQLRRLGLGLLREGVEQDAFFPTKLRGYQIQGGDPKAKGKNFVLRQYGDIPKEARNELDGELRRIKNLGTRKLSSEQEQEIERAYTIGVKQGRYTDD